MASYHPLSNHVCQVTWDEYGWAMVIPSLAIPQWELLTPCEFEGVFHPFFWEMSGHVFKFVGNYPMFSSVSHA